MHTYRLYYHSGHYAVTKLEHVAVVQAIARRDPDGAEEAMRTHLSKGLERMESFVASAPGYK
jgi:DNA-binding GntR family transcriptional regulator